jgi:hypothetical protein
MPWPEIRRILIRILLVEDDNDIAGRLATGLRPEGFVVDRAQNGEDGNPYQVDAGRKHYGNETGSGCGVIRGHGCKTSQPRSQRPCLAAKSVLKYPR